MWPLYIFLYFIGFYGLDALLTQLRLEGAYYAVHAIHNAAIVATTAPEVWLTLTDFSAARVAATNYYAIQLCVALHAYHIVAYFKKLRLDDWLHHGLMIGVALPIGAMLNGGTLLGYSLFFTTGLPGGIDYVLLFLTRNGWLSRRFEKRVNAEINVWIRSPGCVSLAAFVCVANAYNRDQSMLAATGALMTAALNYWNGQYFMRQVVMNTALEA
jgi:hypothetical protein